MSKIRLTLTVEWDLPVDPKELREQYEADSPAQAVRNQQAWLDDGSCDIPSLLEADNLTATVELVEE